GLDRRARDGGTRPAAWAASDTMAANEAVAASEAVAAGEAVATAEVAAFTVPDGLDPDQLLDLADELYRDYRTEDAHTVLHVFDERFGALELTTRQRARRAHGAGMDQATRGDSARGGTARIGA